MINDRKAKLCYSFVTKYIFATYDDKIECKKDGYRFNNHD